MATNELFVFTNIDGQFVPAGVLQLTEQGSQLAASTFAYGNRYLDRANAQEIDPVGLSLKSKVAVRNKRLTPPNGLPFFGGIRDAAPDSWGRRVIEARHQAPANSLPESTYLLHTSSQRTGALDVRNSLTAEPSRAESSVQSLQYLMEGAERIESGLDIPANLADIFVSGSGLGGMRPKVSVRKEDQTLWLAKFPSKSDHLIDVPMIEHATLRLAQACGLNTAQTELTNLQDKNVLIIARFDRAWIGDEKPVEHRLHMISALTLVACDELDSPSKSYADIAGAMQRHGSAHTLAADLRELYARMVFNILVSNDDDHLRNHAFLWDNEVGGWRLSPLYDVMPRPSLSSERFLHLGVGPLGRLASLDNAFAAKERFGLTPTEAAKIIDRVYCTTRQWKVHFEEAGATPEQIERIAPAFRHIDDVATATLRQALT